MATDAQWRKKLRYLHAKTLKVKGIKQFHFDCPADGGECNQILMLFTDYLLVAYPRTAHYYSIPYQAITYVTGQRTKKPNPVDKGTLTELLDRYVKNDWMTDDFITRDSHKYAQRSVSSVDGKGFVLCKKTPEIIYTRIPWSNFAALTQIL